MFVYAFVILCAAGLSAMVYRYDMYEREPWYMLALALAVGAAMGQGVGLLEDQSIRALGEFGDSITGSAMIASTHDESAKLMELWGFTGIPAWVLLDADGRVVVGQIGLLDDPGELLAELSD